MMNRVTKKRRIIKNRYKSIKIRNVRKRQRSRVRSNNKTKRVYTGGLFSFRKRVVPTSDVGKSSGWDCTCRFAENSPEVSVSNTGPAVLSETITPLPTPRAAASVAASVAAAAASMKISPQSRLQPSPPKGEPSINRPNRKHIQNLPPPENSPQSESDILKRVQHIGQTGGAPPEEITKNVICECKKRPVVV
jgi:hypothetical protein